MVTVDPGFARRNKCPQSRRDIESRMALIARRVDLAVGVPVGAAPGTRLTKNDVLADVLRLIGVGEHLDSELAAVMLTRRDGPGHQERR